MATITLCDICGQPLESKPSSRYKVKRQWCLGPDSGWEKLDVHDECVQDILNAKKYNADQFFSAERS